MAVREVKPLGPEQWENVMKKMKRGATKEQVENYERAKRRAGDFKVIFASDDQG